MKKRQEKNTTYTILKYIREKRRYNRLTGGRINFEVTETLKMTETYKSLQARKEDKKV